MTLVYGKEFQMKLYRDTLTKLLKSIEETRTPREAYWMGYTFCNISYRVNEHLLKKEITFEEYSQFLAFSDTIWMRLTRVINIPYTPLS